jgi:hypothetical protein
MSTIQASTLTLTLAFPTSTCQLVQQTEPFKTPLPLPRFGTRKTSLSLPKLPRQRASKLPPRHSLLTPFASRSMRNSHRSAITATTPMKPPHTRIGIQTTAVHKPDHPLIPQQPARHSRATAAPDPSPGSAILSTYQCILSLSHPHNAADLSRACSKHINNHIKPRECPICHKGGAEMKDLNRHMWTHHPDEAWTLGVPREEAQCEICEYSGRKDNVKRHKDKKGHW